MAAVFFQPGGSIVQPGKVTHHRGMYTRHISDVWILRITDADVFADIIFTYFVDVDVYCITNVDTDLKNCSGADIRYISNTYEYTYRNETRKKCVK